MMYKVAFLFDRTNNWIEKPVRSALGAMKELEKKHFYSFFYEAQEVNGFDVVFILGYTKILPSEFLKQNALNLIVHESDLPRGKGFAPVQWQVLEGKNKIPVCLAEAITQVDAGDIFLRSEISLTGYELFDEIRQKQATITVELMHDFLIRYPEYTRTPQSGLETFFPRRSDKDDLLNSEMTIKEQFNHFRIADNEKYPVYFKLDGRKYFLRIDCDKS